MTEIADEWIFVADGDLEKECDMGTENIAVEERSTDDHPPSEYEVSSSDGSLMDELVLLPSDDSVGADSPILSSLIDELSSNLCDAIWEDLELSPGTRCYTHSRNKRLNKSLNFLVTLVFSIVTGLAIGNFVGLKKNCVYEKDLHQQNVQYILDLDLNLTRPGTWVSKVSQNELQGKVSAEHESKDPSKHGDQPEFITVLLVDGDSLSKLPGSKHHVQECKANTFMPVNVTDSELLDKKLESNGSLARDVSVDLKIVLDKVTSSPGRNDDLKESDAKIKRDKINYKLTREKLLENNRKVKKLYKTHFHSSDETLEFVVLLQNLQNTVNDIVLKTQELVLMLLPKGIIESSNFAEMTKTKLYQFTNVVKNILSELFEFIPTSHSKNVQKETKHLLKMTRDLVKSTNKLLKTVFKHVLENEKSVEVKMEKIGNDIIFISERLEKSWKYNKNNALKYKMRQENKKYEKSKNNKYGTVNDKKQDKKIESHDRKRKMAFKH